jgi:hypothetical protein
VERKTLSEKKRRRMVLTEEKCKNRRLHPSISIEKGGGKENVSK